MPHLIKVPDAVWDRLVADAKRELRTATAQAVYLIDQHASKPEPPKPAEPEQTGFRRGNFNPMQNAFVGPPKPKGY